MKKKQIIPLAALALTASLFLGACGGNKEEKTSEASSSKTTQVKQTSSSKKKVIRVRIRLLPHLLITNQKKVIPSAVRTAKLGPVRRLHQPMRQSQPLNK